MGKIPPQVSLWIRELLVYQKDEGEFVQEFFLPVLQKKK